MYVLLPLLLVVDRWLGFKLEYFLEWLMQEKVATAVRIGGSWCPSAAARRMGCECLCSVAASLGGDLAGVMVVAERFRLGGCYCKPR